MTYFSSEQELLLRAEELIGKKISDIDINNRYLKKNDSKGIFGQVLEEGGFYKQLDSARTPDFETLKIELKSTGYIWVYSDTKVSAKERLVLSIIDFHNEYKKNFYSSHAYEQLNHMLLIFYEYEKDKSEKDFVITNYYNYRFNKIPKKDQIIIKSDWETIQNKIKKGEAHKLSEGDTFYLGACPKGVNAKSVRTQPFSNKKAMQRAYSLKTTYMTHLLRTEVFKNVQNKEEFIKDIKELSGKNLEDIIKEKLTSYKGLTSVEIETQLGISEDINRNSKSYLYNLSSRMLGVKNINQTEEFEKANITMKVIRLMKNGKLQEHMSFPYFDYEDIASKPWYESDIYNLLESSKFLFLVFREINAKENVYYFEKVVLWNMPIEDINKYVKPVYIKLQQILDDELVLIPKNNSVHNNLPKASDFMVCHVRPHARNAMDVSKLPNKTKIQVTKNPVNENVKERVDFYLDNHSYVKQSFWLHKGYIQSQITF